MEPWLVLSAVMLSAAALAGPRATAQLHPAVTVRALTILTTAAAIAWVSWGLLVIGALVLDIAPLSEASRVGQLISLHEPAPRWLAAAAGAWAIWSACRVGAGERRRHSLHTSLPGTAGIVMIEADDFVGIAVPGRSARIVLSKSAMESCTSSERAVVIAHEWAHLRHHHSRYVRVVVASATVCPWLRPVESAVRFSVERWADEDTALVLQDRLLVARTIARLALDVGGNRTALPFTHGDTSARARAMLAPAPVTPDIAARGIVAGAGATATGIAGSGLQLHHAIGVL